MAFAPALRRFTFTTHVMASVGWIGAVLVFLALAAIGLTSQDERTVRGAYLVMAPAAWLVLVPLAHAALVSGIALSLGTPWGLIRHYSGERVCPWRDAHPRRVVRHADGSTCSGSWYSRFLVSSSRPTCWDTDRTAPSPLRRHFCVDRRMLGHRAKPPNGRPALVRSVRQSLLDTGRPRG